MQFDCACLCRTVTFQMNSWENSVAFCPAHIPVHPPYRYDYYTSQQVHLSSSFCISDWLFEPSMGPGAIVRHAFFLPKFCLCSSAPLRAPQPFSSVQLLCSPQKGLHLALVFIKPPLQPLLFSPPSLLLPPIGKRQEVNADVGTTWAHCSFFFFLLFSLSRALSFLLTHFFSPYRPPRLKQLLHHTPNTLTYWTSQWRLSITMATCLFVVYFCCFAV